MARPGGRGGKVGQTSGTKAGSKQLSNGGSIGVEGFSWGEVRKVGRGKRGTADLFSWTGTGLMECKLTGSCRG